MYWVWLVPSGNNKLLFSNFISDSTVIKVNQNLVGVHRLIGYNSQTHECSDLAILSLNMRKWVNNLNMSDFIPAYI